MDEGSKFPTDEPLRRNSQVKWKAVFRDIAFVNRAFFVASADILWEHMHSLEPFLALLEPSSSGKGPLAYCAGITKTAWQRFEMYSRSTKSLALKAPNTPPSSCWASYLTTSHGRPDRFFPAMKILYLNSTDSISMMITFTALSHIDLLTINPRVDSIVKAEAQEAITALVAALAEGPRSVTVLRILQPVNAQCIRNLSRLRGLSHFHVVLRCHDIRGLGPHLWSHNQVVIEEAVGMAINDKYVKRRNNQLQKFAHFGKAGRYLLVLGGSSMHNTVASACSAYPLQALRFQIAAIELTYSGSEDEDVATPTTISNHLLRKPSDDSLLSVEATGLFSERLHPQAASRARTSPLFNDLRPLVSRFASCHTLMVLSISDILFGPSDVVQQMFSVTKHLPQLQQFCFLPYVLGVDQLALPSLSALADIPQYNPRLTSFVTLIDFSSGSLSSISSTKLPLNHPPAKQMRHLGLIPASPGHLPNHHSTQEMLDLSMYLYRIFPNLWKMTRADESPDSSYKKFWEPVDQTIESFRQIQKLPSQSTSVTIS
ncbi:hypothetical protein NMY22_g14093 [Coprinellus aureogranulatus]|nr:hypothetical protein NMY22_g14093 [Coprinellus aureogranulatus]